MLALALVWLAGAVVATSVGVLAVRQVAEQVGDPAVPALPAQAVGSALPTPSPALTPTGAPMSPPAATPAVVTTAPEPLRSLTFRSTGGTVGAQCAGTRPRLLYATPADGYALDEQSVGGAELEVRFESETARARLTISCASSTPRLVDERVDPRSGGGGRSDDDD